MRKDFLVFGAPQIGEEEIDEVLDSLRSRWIGTGPKVTAFEEEFRRYKGVGEAVAVSSCTAALHLSLLAAGISPGDEVIVPAMTFCATVNAIIHAGGTPVLADVDPATHNIGVDTVLDKITPRTRAILPVHFAGRMCDVEALAEIADARNLTLIEDCAHAIESAAGSIRAGTTGRFGCFSFYATKNVTTAEGGMVITSDPDAADRIRRLALHGLSADAWSRYSDKSFRHYFVDDLGFKYNMTDLQAAIGIHQLRRIDANWDRRKAIWEYYQAELGDLPLQLPAPVEPSTRHAYHLYTVLVDEAQAGLDRDAFIDSLYEKKIGTGVHYRAIPEHPYYQRQYGWSPSQFPVSHRIGLQTVSLPLTAAMSDQDAEDVVAAVRDTFGR